MRKIVASEFVTLDGFMSGPQDDMSWVGKNFNDEMGKYAGGLMDSMDTVLLGRVTYQIMTKVWPLQTEATSPGADKMNNTPKIVLSNTLKTAEWGTYNNVTLLHDHVADEIKKQKELPGKNIVIYGSGNMVRSLTQLGLIDEVQLLVHPLVMGSGKLLFSGLTTSGLTTGHPAGINLKLLKTETFGNGVVVLYYEPQGK